MWGSQVEDDEIIKVSKDGNNLRCPKSKHLRGGGRPHNATGTELSGWQWTRFKCGAEAARDLEAVGWGRVFQEHGLQGCCCCALLLGSLKDYGWLSGRDQWEQCRNLTFKSKREKTIWNTRMIWVEKIWVISEQRKHPQHQQHCGTQIRTNVEKDRFGQVSHRCSWTSGLLDTVSESACIRVLGNGSCHQDGK